MSEAVVESQAPEDLRYPVGKWDRQPAGDAAAVAAAIETIEALQIGRAHV